MIPLIDSLAHPTLTGRWLGKENLDTGFDSLVTKLHNAQFIKAFAIGLAGVEQYQHHEFIAACYHYPELIPIAGFDLHVTNIESELDTIKELGFYGIKIHPRFCSASYAHPNFSQALIGAHQRNLVVFICTYSHQNIANYPTQEPLFDLVKLLQTCPSAKVVLVHGGDVQLLKYAELTRFSPNLLLDLSLTFMKYAGSSLDFDIQFLFQQFDRKICIGTDHPEYSHQSVRERFEFFGRSVQLNKLQNIAHRNLSNFFGLDL